MPLNGNTFTRLQSWVANASLGIKIRADLMDQDSNDIAGGISAVAAIANNFVKLVQGITGAQQVGFQQTGAGAVPTTVATQLLQWPSVIGFGAVGDGVTLDTAALIAAQTASPFVFLPAGKTFLVGGGVNYWQFYGPGKIVTTGETYSPTAYPRTGTAAIAYNNNTFGSYENAVAAAFTINGTQAQAKTNTQVNGTSGSGYATPVGQQRDHVALFVSAFAPTTISTGASSTYTTTTMTATELVGLTTIKPGMIVDTKHGTPYTGTVQSFVPGTGTITVDSWWLNGGVPAAGTPANGTGAKVNPVTVTFGGNIVVSSTSTGTDAVSGLEIDVAANNATGAANSIGLDFVGLGTSAALSATRARGTFTIGHYAQGAGIGTGFVADSTGGVGFEARDTVGNALQARKSGTVYWTVNSAGLVQQNFNASIFNASATYSVLTTDNVIVNLSGGAVLTLPAITGLANRIWIIVAVAGCTIKNAGGTTIKTPLSGTTAIVACDGSFYY